MQLRYKYRLYPTSVQRQALARVFGCARVVFNDGLRARQYAYQARQPFPTDAELSARLTASKATPDRAWLSEVSVVPLQQSLADLNTAYRRFFASRVALRNWRANGRKGSKPRAVGPPRLKSRKDGRQSVRFTANSRFAIIPNGRLQLAKIGDVKVRWSRQLPSAPSSVTVIKDAAGRYFASFVVETDPGADVARFPTVDAEVGIDLGLDRFAVLSDGTVIRSPKFLRRAERKLKRAQRAYSHKQKGSQNKEKSRARLARAHARVAARRTDFHHQVSTRIIRETQAVYTEDLCVIGLARSRAGQVRPRRRVGGVHPDAGLQGRSVWAGVCYGGPVRAHQPSLLGLWGPRRPQAAERQAMDLRRMRRGA